MIWKAWYEMRHLSTPLRLFDFHLFVSYQFGHGFNINLRRAELFCLGDNIRCCTRLSTKKLTTGTPLTSLDFLSLYDINFTTVSIQIFASPKFFASPMPAHNIFMSYKQIHNVSPPDVSRFSLFVWYKVVHCFNTNLGSLQFFCLGDNVIFC